MAKARFGNLKRMPPDPVTPEQLANYDVRVGSVRVKACLPDLKDKRHSTDAICWILPGGKKIMDRASAVEHARKLNDLLGGNQ